MRMPSGISAWGEGDIHGLHVGRVVLADMDLAGEGSAGKKRVRRT